MEVSPYPQAAYCSLPCANEGCRDVCSCRPEPKDKGSLVPCLVELAQATGGVNTTSNGHLAKTKALVKEGWAQWTLCDVQVDNEQTSKDYRAMVDAFWTCLITRACMAFMKPPLSKAASAVAWEPLTKFKVVTRVPLATFTQPTHATSAAHTLPNTLTHCHAPAIHCYTPTLLNTTTHSHTLPHKLLNQLPYIASHQRYIGHGFKETPGCCCCG